MKISQCDVQLWIIFEKIKILDSLKYIVNIYAKFSIIGKRKEGLSPKIMPKVSLKQEIFLLKTSAYFFHITGILKIVVFSLAIKSLS